jgi:hypothetical protein
MKRKRIVLTNNREIYEKFNMLHFSPEVILKGVRKMQVEKILRSLNKDTKALDIEMVGNYIVIRKLKPTNFDIYLR